MKKDIVFLSRRGELHMTVKITDLNTEKSYRPSLPWKTRNNTDLSIYNLVIEKEAPVLMGQTLGEPRWEFVSNK